MKLLYLGVAGVVALVALHPLLAKVSVGCPIRTGTPEKVDYLRRLSAASYAGKPSAPARPALGFVLGKTTLADFDAWSRDLRCTKIAGNEMLRTCSAVPPAAIGEPEGSGPADVSFEFRADRTLSIVTTTRRGLSVGHANAITGERLARLEQQLAGAHTSAGDNTPAYFAKGPLQSFMKEWTFGDYGASLSEVRLADTGIMVRERYAMP